MKSIVIYFSQTAFGVTPQDVFYPAGTTDLSSVATKIISPKPKYFTTMNGSDSADAQLFNALAQGGFTGVMFTGSQPSAITLNNIMSPEVLKGFMCAASPTEFDPALTPEAQDFKNLWIKEYGDWQEPNVSSFVNDYFALKVAVAGRPRGPGAAPGEPAPGSGPPPSDAPPGS